jgi:hypothetical protein
LLEQLYARLYVLHLKSVQIVQQWLDWRVGIADAVPGRPAPAPTAGATFAFQGGPHA